MSVAKTSDQSPDVGIDSGPGPHRMRSITSKALADIREAPAVWKRVGLVLAMIAAITLGHYLTPHSQMLLHSIFQHLYYVPIILGAVFFGWGGGLLTAACTAMCYAPHIHVWGEIDLRYTLNQYAELGSFFLIGGVTGFLADQERSRARQLQQKSEELEKACRELEDSFEHVKRADRVAAVGQLGAALAHEIRTPLSSIEGAVDVLEKKETPEELRAEFRGIIRKECRRLEGLLTELLNFAKPRAPRFRQVDLAERIRGVVNLVKSSISERHTSIRVHAASDLPTVECDPDQIKQVILDLVMNALQAMPEGGDLTISASVQGSTVAVSVTDQGEGIPEDLIDRIFEPYFTTKESGTGLGLAVVRQIVERHEGKIQVRNNDDRGATFTVYLPLTRGNDDETGKNSTR